MKNIIFVAALVAAIALAPMVAVANTPDAPAPTGLFGDPLSVLGIIGWLMLAALSFGLGGAIAYVVGASIRDWAVSVGWSVAAVIVGYGVWLYWVNV